MNTVLLFAVGFLAVLVALLFIPNQLEDASLRT